MMIIVVYSILKNFEINLKENEIKEYEFYDFLFLMVSLY